jgi:hypothetical protein
VRLWRLTLCRICLSQIFFFLDRNLFKCRNLFLFCEIVALRFPFRNQVFTALYRVLCLLYWLKWSSLWSRNENACFVAFLFERKIFFIEASLMAWLVTYGHLLRLLLWGCSDKRTETGKGFALNDSALIRWAKIFFHRVYWLQDKVNNNKKATQPKIKIKSADQFLCFFLFY